MSSVRVRPSPASPGASHGGGVRHDHPHTLVQGAPALADAIAAVERAPVVAFDTEFHAERTYWPRLMLLQVATPDGIWLADPLAQDLAPLCRAIAAPGKTVVGHALRNDLRILWQAFGVRFDSVFDTQVAGAFLGCGLQVGLGHLVQRLLHVSLTKGEQMADWSQRPLPDNLRRYAAADVAHLIAVADLQRDELEARGRLGWCEEEIRPLCDPTQYDRDPDSAGDRVAGGRKLDARDGGVLYALAALRERMARDDDVVPHFLITDETLIALAKAKPRDVAALRSDRRLQNRAVQRHADRWTAAVAHGLAHPLQRAPSRPPPAPELEGVASLAMLLVGELADREAIAPQLIARREAIVDALRGSPGSEGEFVAACGLEGWRAGLAGPALWRLVSGQSALRCRPDAQCGWRVAVSDG